MFESHYPEKRFRLISTLFFYGVVVMEFVLFYLFSSLAILSGLMMIRSENPVHSLLFLVIVFCNGAGLLLLLEVDFLAMLFIIVYVGAIAVLFLFVLMMLNLKLAKYSAKEYLPVGSLIMILFLIDIFLLFQVDFLTSSEVCNPLPQWFTCMDKITNIEAIGQVFYTYFFYFFGVASLVLLVGIIGAIFLSMEQNDNVRRQQIFQQVSRDFERAVFLSAKQSKHD